VPDGKSAVHEDPAVDLNEHEPIVDFPSTEEELEVRRELSHNLQQMQPIVATMSLDDDWSDDDELDDDDEDYAENEFGMNNFREYMSDEYMVKMNALSRKYNEDSEETFIPADTQGMASTTEMVQSPAQSSMRAEKKPTKAAKGVRFAESLEIADTPTQKEVNQDIEAEIEMKPAPLAEIVQERSSTKPLDATMPMKPFQRVSKFKAARMAADIAASFEVDKKSA
jgi:hypothetical protein